MRSLLLSLVVPLCIASSTRAVHVPRAASSPHWADVESATIFPGVNTGTAGQSCTSNFVFYNGAGDIFLGQAAHCSATGEEDQSNGCTTTAVLPEGTPVNVTGASKKATLAYSAWNRMQQANESDADACAYNDFSLIKLDPADYGKVKPSLPRFGGPSGIRTTDVRNGEPIYGFGNSVLRKGVKALQPKYGVQQDQIGHGWSHVIYGHFGIPGDSGSLAIDANGNAVGILSTYDLVPLPGTNGFTDFQRAFAYLKAQPEFADVELALGTKTFNFALPLPKRFE